MIACVANVSFGLSTRWSTYEEFCVFFRRRVFIYLCSPFIYLFMYLFIYLFIYTGEIISYKQCKKIITKKCTIIGY